MRRQSQRPERKSWSGVGVLGGCNLAMALSTQFVDQPAEMRPALTLRFVACNAGMLLGRLLAELNSLSPAT